MKKNLRLISLLLAMVLPIGFLAVTAQGIYGIFDVPLRERNEAARLSAVADESEKANALEKSGAIESVSHDVIQDNPPGR